MTFSLQTPITSSITRYAEGAGKHCPRAGLKDAREIGFGTRNRDRIQEGAWLALWRGRGGVVPSRTRRPLTARENGRVSHAPYFSARVRASMYRVYVRSIALTSASIVCRSLARVVFAARQCC